LEVLAHAFRPRTLPGPHHAVRIDIPKDQIEVLDPVSLPGWESRGSQEARGFGDQWLREERSAALIVPAVTARPVGMLCLINPRHPAVTGILVSQSFDVPWDERIF
jgi:RES domain-containing protein